MILVDQRSEQFLAHMWCLQRVSAASLHRPGAASLLPIVHGGSLLVMLGQMESANDRRTRLWGQWYWPFKLLAELANGWLNHVPAVNLVWQGRTSYIDSTKIQLCAPTGSKPPVCHTHTHTIPKAASFVLCYPHLFLDPLHVLFGNKVMHRSPRIAQLVATSLIIGFCLATTASSAWLLLSVLTLMPAECFPQYLATAGLNLLS